MNSTTAGLTTLPISVSSIALIDTKTADSLMDGIENLGLSLSEADDGPQEPTLTPPPEAVKKTRKGSLLPQIMASLVLAIAAMIEGYSSGYTSPALASMKHENSSIPIDSHQASWVGSLMPLNALIGGIVGGTIIEKFGRKFTIMATGLPYILCNQSSHYANFNGRKNIEISFTSLATHHLRHQLAHGLRRKVHPGLLRRTDHLGSAHLPQRNPAAGSERNVGSSTHHHRQHWHSPVLHPRFIHRLEDPGCYRCSSTCSIHALDVVHTRHAKIPRIQRYFSLEISCKDTHWLCF